MAYILVEGKTSRQATRVQLPLPPPQCNHRSALSRLAREGKFDAQRAQQAFSELGIETEKVDPAIA